MKPSTGNSVESGKEDLPDPIKTIEDAKSLKSSLTVATVLLNSLNKTVSRRSNGIIDRPTNMLIFLESLRSITDAGLSFLKSMTEQELEDYNEDSRIRHITEMEDITPVPVRCPESIVGPDLSNMLNIINDLNMNLDMLFNDFEQYIIETNQPFNIADPAARPE